MGLFCMLAALLLSRLSGLPSGLLNELDTAVGTRTHARRRAHTCTWGEAAHSRRMFTCCSLEGFQEKSFSFNVHLHKSFEYKQRLFINTRPCCVCAAQHSCCAFPDIQILKKRYTDVHNDARMLRASWSEMFRYDMFLRS